MILKNKTAPSVSPGRRKGAGTMATAKKLPSGNWRVRAYDKTRGTTKSFTAATKKSAELAAIQWLNGMRSSAEAQPGRLTVRQAVREYIDSKSNILSPSSIRGYEIIYRSALDGIGDKNLEDLEEKELQNWVNQNAAKYAPKSVKSQYGLVTAALRQQKVLLDYKSVLLPRIKKSEPLIPTTEQIATILSMIEGTVVELPVTIAVTMGLRQSEIAALKWTDYDGEHLNIHAAVVPSPTHNLVRKETTKSEASTRIIDVDELCKQRLDRAEHKSEYISGLTPRHVLKVFQRLCEQNGLPKFTMHAQRHGNASMMLANGIPDKYAMARLGQSSPNMIKNVYQHLYADKQKEYSKTISNAFSKTLATKFATNE